MVKEVEIKRQVILKHLHKLELECSTDMMYLADLHLISPILSKNSIIAYTRNPFSST